MEKVLMVYSNADEASWLIDSYKNTNYLGIDCIQGRFASECWCTGKTVYIPLDEIASIVEFDSLEDYISSVNKIEIEKEG